MMVFKRMNVKPAIEVDDTLDPPGVWCLQEGREWVESRLEKNFNLWQAIYKQALPAVHMIRNHGTTTTIEICDYFSFSSRY